MSICQLMSRRERAWAGTGAGAESVPCQMDAPWRAGQKPPTVPPVAAPENDEPHKNVLSMSIKIHFA